MDKEIIGTLQLSFIQYLTYQGGIRAQIEAVRIRSDQRGQGLGQLQLLADIGAAAQAQLAGVELGGMGAGEFVDVLRVVADAFDVDDHALQRIDQNGDKAISDEEAEATFIAMMNAVSSVAPAPESALQVLLHSNVQKWLLFLMLKNAAVAVYAWQSAL